MISKEFKIEILSNAERVWFALWDDHNYRNWTSVFHEGSYAVSDWKEGSKIHFLIPSGSGLYSIIEQNKPSELMTFRHIGEILNFQEQEPNEEVKQWTGATESYSLSEHNGITTLTTLFTSIESHIDFFDKFIPKALEKIKSAAENLQITIETEIIADKSKVWEKWTNPADIIHWNAATKDWYCPRAENELKPGGSFNFRMEARDGSMGFDFTGTYQLVDPENYIEYNISDGRNVKIQFTENDGLTHIKQTFEAEKLHPANLQKTGWQSILNNFKVYTESQA